MKLTQDQIAEIKQFINSRGFTHIEVEMEILDHVASAVETKLEQNPKKSITQAIQEVHASFGVFGFSKVEDAFRLSFSKKFRKIQHSILNQYFLSYKSGITLLTFILSLCLVYFAAPTPIAFFSFYIYTIGLTSSFVLLSYYRKIFKKWRKKSLAISSLKFTIPQGFFLVGYGFNLYGNYIVEKSAFPELIFACLISATFIYVLVTKDTYKEVYNWTNERYLKYSD